MTKRYAVLTALAACLLAAGGCKKDESKPAAESGSKAGGESGGESGGQVGGAVIQIDGSSTVFPISQAVAEEFQKSRGGRVTVGVSGTGGGFKKFCRGETAISDASRPIKDSETQQCKAAGIDFIELPVAYDGLAVMVNPQNDWVDHLTVEELKKIWAPEAQGKITTWSQVRQGWPNKPLHLFGAGVDSGTYDYFTEAIVGKEHSSRGDFTSSEDDNVLVQGIATDQLALGFFGFAYYGENQDKLKLVPVDDGKPDNGKGPITPSAETVANGTYQPLSRPIFIYVSTKHMKRPEVKAFVEYYLNEGAALVKEVGYIPLPDKAYELARKRFAESKTGTVFHGSKVGVTVEELLSGS
jgi:phosphate transport system substrate-binding protein